MEKSYLSFFLFVLLFSCQIIEPGVDLPTYLYIDEVEVETTSEQGTASHNIRDVWVFSNDNIRAVYELPARIPIVGDGVEEIKIFAGILNNGLGSPRIQYPFYDHYVFEHDMVPMKVDTIVPVFTYHDNLRYWIEDFEDPGMDLEAVGETGTFSRIANSELVYEGNGCGYLRLGEGEDFIEIQGNEVFSNFTLQTRLFLELNYKTNNEFNVGFYIGDDKNAFWTLKNTIDVSGDPQWRKTYIDLTTVLRISPTPVTYTFFIDVFKEDGVAVSETWIDNVKLVYTPN